MQVLFENTNLWQTDDIFCSSVDVRPNRMTIKSYKAVYPSNAKRKFMKLILINFFSICRMVLGYEDRKIVLLSTGKDYDEFKLSFTGI